MHTKKRVQYRRWKVKDPSCKKSPPTARWQDWFDEKPGWWGEASFIEISGWCYQRELSLPQIEEVKKRQTKKGTTYSRTVQMSGELPFCEPFEITITIDASLKGWNELHSMALGDPESLGKAIYLNFTKPVMEHPEILTRQRIGGTRYDKNVFMRESRQFTAAAYVVAKYFAKRPKHAWPKSFVAFLEGLDTHDTIHQGTSLLCEGGVAFAAWIREFESKIEPFTLNAKGHRRAFEDTYLHSKNRYMDDAHRIFTEEMARTGTAPTIEDLHSALRGLP